MAKAKQTKVEVHTVTLEDRVVLELTQREAKVLRLILESIGGSPSESSRGDADAMAGALRSIGVPCTDQGPYIDPKRDAIYFTKKVED